MKRATRRLPPGTEYGVTDACGTRPAGSLAAARAALEAGRAAGTACRVIGVRPNGTPRPLRLDEAFALDAEDQLPQPESARAAGVTAHCAGLRRKAERRRAAGRRDEAATAVREARRLLRSRRELRAAARAMAAAESRGALRQGESDGGP